jgi:hypothetical protein
MRWYSVKQAFVFTGATPKQHQATRPNGRPCNRSARRPAELNSRHPTAPWRAIPIALSRVLFPSHPKAHPPSTSARQRTDPPQSTAKFTVSATAPQPHRRPFPPPDRTNQQTGPTRRRAKRGCRNKDDTLLGLLVCLSCGSDEDHDFFAPRGLNRARWLLHNSSNPHPPPPTTPPHRCVLHVPGRGRSSPPPAGRGTGARARLPSRPRYPRPLRRVARAVGRGALRAPPLPLRPAGAQRSSADPSVSQRQGAACVRGAGPQQPEARGWRLGRPWVQDSPDITNGALTHRCARRATNVGYNHKTPNPETLIRVCLPSHTRRHGRHPGAMPGRGAVVGRAKTVGRAKRHTGASKSGRSRT